MIAEVISIGDELTSGQRLDTNSQWLSRQLGDLGIRVLYHTTVADDLAANAEVFRLAIERADFVVATGGLGPTADDLTRDALAAATGVELVLDEASLEHIRGLFARHNRDMPERNRLQAMFPAGSRPIFNPRGTAPGIWLECARPGGRTCRLFALPGVPAEMFEMFHQTVGPAIAAALPERKVIRHRRIKCFGAGESHVEQMLPDLIRRGREPQVGITVHEATITLRITATGATEDECQRGIADTEQTIRAALGNLVFGEEDDELEDVVLRMLAERGRSLATVESGTRGLLAHWLTAAKAEQTPFRGGVVLPGANEIAAWLAAAAEPGAEAAGGTIAERLAAAARQRFAADYALAIGEFPTEVAGQKSNAGAPAPEYFFALVTPSKVTVRSSSLASHPSIWRPRAAKQALNLLRLQFVERG